MLRRNVLIFHAGALGDFVLSWPLAMALGRMYAQSRIIYVTAAQKGALAERVLRIDNTDVEAGWHHLFAVDAKLPEKVQRMLNGTHQIFSFVGTEDSQWAANVRRLAPHVKLVCLEPNPPTDFAGHASEYLLSQLHAEPVIGPAVGAILRSIAERGTGYSRPGGGAVVIHPGAGSPKKCWSREKFLVLAEKLNATVVMGEVERERWKPEEIAPFGKVIFPTTLLELLSVLAKATAFVGNDSGPGHLSGMIGVPTVSIFSSTNPGIWRPMGPRVNLIGNAEASVDHVVSVVGEAIKSEIRIPKSESNPNDE